MAGHRDATPPAAAPDAAAPPAPGARVEIADAGTLRAFAHPLRLRILQELAQLGQANVARIAEQVGEPANSVSYHLSILARHGLVLPAQRPEGATHRERWWQTASSTGFTVESVDERTRPALTEALVVWYQQRAGEVVRRLMASEADAEARGLPVSQSSFGVWLTPEEARGFASELRGAVHRLAERYEGQRTAGTLADGPGGDAHFYLVDHTFFPDLTDQPRLRSSAQVGDD